MSRSGSFVIHANVYFTVSGLAKLREFDIHFDQVDNFHSTRINFGQKLISNGSRAKVLDMDSVVLLLFHAHVTIQLEYLVLSAKSDLMT